MHGARVKEGGNIGRVMSTDKSRVVLHAAGVTTRGRVASRASLCTPAAGVAGSIAIGIPPDVPQFAE
jgi:hypothetical protein